MEKERERGQGKGRKGRCEKVWIGGRNSKMEWRREAWG